MIVILIALSVWALVLAIASAGAQGLGSALYLIAGMGPLCLWTWWQIRLGDEHRHALHEAAGIIDVLLAPHAHYEASTGLVLDTRRRVLTVSLDGIACRYAYADIRDCQVQAMGLVLWVKDAEHPLWRITMARASRREHWHGLLSRQIGARPQSTTCTPFQNA